MRYDTKQDSRDAEDESGSIDRHFSRAKVVLSALGLAVTLGLALPVWWTIFNAGLTILILLLLVLYPILSPANITNKLISYVNASGPVPMAQAAPEKNLQNYGHW